MPGNLLTDPHLPKLTRNEPSAPESSLRDLFENGVTVPRSFSETGLERFNFFGVKIAEKRFIKRKAHLNTPVLYVVANTHHNTTAQTLPAWLLLYSYANNVAKKKNQVILF